MNKLFCYPRWSSCKKAVNWLDANNIEFEYIDITIYPPNVSVLKNIFNLNDFPIKKFFNTSGVSYRELGMKDKLPKLSNDEAFELLANDGKLIKRPFFIFNNTLLVGFKEDLWKNSKEKMSI